MSQGSLCHAEVGRWVGDGPREFSIRDCRVREGDAQLNMEQVNLQVCRIPGCLSRGSKSKYHGGQRSARLRCGLRLVIGDLHHRFLPANQSGG